MGLNENKPHTRNLGVNMQTLNKSSIHDQNEWDLRSQLFSIGRVMAACAVSSNQKRAPGLAVLSMMRG